MRPMTRVVSGFVLVVALIGGLATVAAPAGAAGLGLTATSATTGLQPGSVVSARITGAAPRQVVRYGVCATGVPCTLSDVVRTDVNGAAPIAVRLSGTATYVEGGRTGVKACRPDRCQVAIHPEGQPSAVVRMPVRFLGEKVTATFTPTTGLVDGRLVTVSGRVRGAEGRSVRVRQQGYDLLDATVAADGTFRTQVRVWRRPTPTVGCSPTAANATPCVLEVSVVGDPSFGIASTSLRFLAAGVAATVTPARGLADGQVVQVRSTGDAGLKGRRARVRQLACVGDGPAAPTCTAGAAVTATLDASGRLTTSLPVRRVVGGTDCGRTRYPVADCSVEVTVLTASGAVDPTVEATRALVLVAPRA